MTRLSRRHPKRRCTATTRAGRPCRAWALHGTEPSLCSVHAGVSTSPGPGNRNAIQHGFYAAFHPDPEQGFSPINGVIHDLAAKQAQLSDLISQCLDDNPAADATQLARLLAIHGQNASRLGRLLRDQSALSKGTNDQLQAGIAQALEELSAEWGVRV
jgi:hypothetical protein